MDDLSQSGSAQSTLISRDYGVNILSSSENKENMNFKHLCSTQFGLQYLGLHKPLFYNYNCS